jgi:hypothetical protein
LKAPAITAQIMVAIALAIGTLLHPVRRFIGPDWTQADHAGWLSCFVISLCCCLRMILSDNRYPLFGIMR